MALLAASLLPTLATADGPSFLRLFGARKVEADPEQAYELTEVEGPWMILAETFSGPEGKKQAHQLVIELRRDYNMPAYVYKENFDFTRPVGSFGPDRKQLRYANAARYEAYAVLVGEFDSVNHPELKSTLQTLKTIQPGVFQQVSPETEVGPMAAIRRIHQQLTQGEQRKTRGPMFNAFVTRNPMLPDNFTQAPEVDSFVRRLNENVEHSLLDCKGKYTVVVRTFEGLSTTMIGGKVEKDLKPSSERLDQSADLANQMVMALREKGVEAYEFHDRSKSIVTVGSFESLGRPVGNGFEYAPEIRRTIEQYASGERFERDTQGRMVRVANHIKKIPFDVEPHPIAVPKVTKRSLYSAATSLGR
ncbi:hypothetical protein [Candidatus Laterigemmans baculatus]|uniref:hypothetical protein n=1 Tax=Candidatus Laterigemmans baculatus TaxID=2770505 RepID=UPI001F337466|nr:hypothetical protein [Candidatus Laterigemmans baculatus]